MDSTGKKTAAAVHEEIAREIDQWLRVLFRGQRKTGHLDLEAVEMMVRTGMHRAGAAGLTAMLEVPAPVASERSVLCPCGGPARHQGARSQALLNAAGEGERAPPFYSFVHCPQGALPPDTPLDIART